jgi:hypothetical protein
MIGAQVYGPRPDNRELVMSVRRGLACGGAAVVSLLAAGCAAPVPSNDAYRHAALMTATAMVSDLASARLAAGLGLRGRSFSALTDDNVTDAEDDADSVSSTFGSRQPPGPGSDALRQRLTAALSDGTGALTDLRVAVRLGRRAQAVRALAEVSSAERRFQGLERELR